MTAGSPDEHRAGAADRRGRAAALTVSDTRSPEDDASGARIRRGLEAAGHEVAATALLPDEPTRVAAQLRAWLAADPPIDAIVSNGGTGLAPRDTTIEAVEGLLEKRIEGFGELFRMLSWHEIGAAAMASRAVAGVAGTSLIFALPGSTNAVGLAMEKLILPELPHLLAEIGAASG